MIFFHNMFILSFKKIFKINFFRIIIKYKIVYNYILYKIYAYMYIKNNIAVLSLNDGIGLLQKSVWTELLVLDCGYTVVI